MGTEQDSPKHPSLPRCLRDWQENFRTLTDSELEICLAILNRRESRTTFKLRAENDGRWRFPSDPITYCKFLVAFEWWYDGVPCADHKEIGCRVCILAPTPNYVFRTTGWSQRFHTTDECSGLVMGQGGVERRGGEPASIIKVRPSEAISTGRTACLVCLPPESDTSDGFEPDAGIGIG